MMTDNIILIGMPGAGKSTIGVVLAKALGYHFIDSDLLIQEEEKKRLFEIIEDVGIEGFLEVENRVNAGIQVHKTVIATGGSVVYGEAAMEHLKSIGTVVYINVPYEDLQERLGDLLKRGVAIRKGNTLLDLYNERVPLYEKYADVTVDVQGIHIREAMELVKSSVEKLECK